jgi:hypothetical protein
MRRPYIFLLPVLLGQCVDGSVPGSITLTPNQRITISSTPVALDTSDPARRRLGALRFLGGWQLTSDARGFGGLSAIDVVGNRVTALGDGGTIMRFRLGRFGNATDASILRLPDGCGKVVRKYDNDTEALAHDGRRTAWWVSYESRNAICRTSADFTVGESVAKPGAIAAWPRKSGPESMTRLADGRFLVIAEDARDYGDIRSAVIFDRDPTDPAAVATTLGYRAPAGFKPTDVAQMPDGRLLVLNRRFALTSLFSAELVLLPRLARDPRGLLEGPTIARFQSPVIADNFEGLSVSVENGKPIIWVISDNNFMRWQRTLLLKFALD